MDSSETVAAPAEHTAAQEPGVERIQAFSDGVFAIAITLLVLNIALAPGANDLPHALVDAWPRYLSYAISFLIIGIIWAQHHTIFSLIRGTDHVFLLINILFLMWLAFLPFPAHVLGEYLGKPGEQAAMSLYAGVFLIGTIPFSLLWYYASWRGRLLKPGIDPRLVRITTRSYNVGPVCYAIDFLLSFVSTPISLALFLLLAVFYAVTPIPRISRALHL